VQCLRPHGSELHQKLLRSAESDDSALSPVRFARLEAARETQLVEQRRKGFVQRLQIGRPDLLRQAENGLGRLGFRNLSCHEPSDPPRADAAS